MTGSIQFDTHVGNVGVQVQVCNELDGTTTDLQFSTFPVRLGRNRMNDLVLFHEYVSSWHAMVGFINGALNIVQVGKSNSVRVNGQKLHPNEAVPITEQDGVRIVPFSLVFQVSRVRGPTAPHQLPGTMMAPQVTDDMLSGRGDPGGGGPDAALEMLNRMAERYTGARLDNPADVAEFGRKLTTTMDQLLGFVVEMRQAHEALSQKFGLTARGGQAAGDRATDARELGTVLFSPLDRGGAQGLADLMAALKVHQVALVRGVEEGIRALLDRLDPAAISRRVGKQFRLGGGAKALWDAYQREFAESAEDNAEVFKLVFGRRFRNAYTSVQQSSDRDDDQGND